MIVEWNDRALASVERQPEMSKSSRDDTRTKLPPRSWEWSVARVTLVFPQSYSVVPKPFGGADSVGGELRGDKDCPHTPSIAFRHPPPNSARFSYATEEALFISAQLSSDAVSAPRKDRVLIWL